MTTVHVRVAAISPPRSPFGKMSSRLRRCQIIIASGLLGITHLDSVANFTCAGVTPQGRASYLKSRFHGSLRTLYPVFLGSCDQWSLFGRFQGGVSVKS